jgi:DNA-binding transcriptional LysR family regulator
MKRTIDRLADLEAFVRVAETGGIGSAAARLGVAKSAVSRRLKNLEERLGVRLVNRTTRRLSLTETGRAYCERAMVILGDLDDADQAAAAVHGTLSGSLRVAAPLSFGIRHLAPAVSEFLVRHAALSIEMDLNDRRVDIVEEGFDIAIRIGVLEDSSLIARKLFDAGNVLCASPGYLARHGTPERPEDVANHAGLIYASWPGRRAWTWRHQDGGERSVKPSARLVANNGDILFAAAEAGLGLCLSPSFIAYQSIKAGRLVPILTAAGWTGATGFAVYPPGRHLSAKVRAFVDFLAERFGGTPYWETCLTPGAI